ncbi:aldehyde dehydrogenase family protein [Dictyobacter arantiisoli]|nr:aldehyde dehydrogenase family protein [Dictyobacter arantiisoli]
MTVDTHLGEIAPSSHTSMDSAVQTLTEHKDAWIRTPLATRLAIIDTLITDFASLAQRWVAAIAQAKGLDEHDPLVSEDWGGGAWPVLLTLRQLRQVLSDIQQDGHPHIPGPVVTRPDGQVTAQVFPFRPYDRVLFPGVTAEVWMQPGVTVERLPDTQAISYQTKEQEGKLALVLGAGNVASIGPLDLLYKLFVENRVVLYKANPVNAYLGPLLTEAFRALIKPGFLDIVYGGADEGSYLCQHPGIDEIHITGSDKTFEAIVFGTGEEGEQRKASGQSLLTKPITGELGNVSPVIIVPGPWSQKDIAYQAEHLVSSVANNEGFNCNATRVIIQQRNWTQRTQLLKQMRHIFAQLPSRPAYYPGARERQQRFLAAHPEAELFGQQDQTLLPWTFIPDVPANQSDDICFTTEAFCSLCAETALEASTIVEYIQKAVTFANQQLWGTLNVTLIVHPATLKLPGVAAAIDQAIADLRYGTIGVNYWAGTSFVISVTPWGAFPGHSIEDIQSGNGIVHNTLMFSQLQKCVLRAPFRSLMTPPWFVSQNKVAYKLFKKLTYFETAPSWRKLLDIAATAMGR